MSINKNKFTMYRTILEYIIRENISGTSGTQILKR